MSNKQQHINENLKAAEKGALHKDLICATIKADFRRMYSDALTTNKEPIMTIYSKLASRYGKSTDVIRKIVKG